MSPVFYHHNRPASQNKLLKSSPRLFSNIVDLFGEIIIRLFRCVGDLYVEMCELQLSLLSEVKNGLGFLSNRTISPRLLKKEEGSIGSAEQLGQKTRLVVLRLPSCGYRQRLRSNY